MHKCGGCVETNFHTIQTQPIKWSDFSLASWLGVVVCEHANLDLLDMNRIKQCWKDREGLISLVIQSAPDTLIITLLFVMSAVTPTVKTYEGREEGREGGRRAGGLKGDA